MFLQPLRSCILVAGHETLVFAQWNSISKFCLSASGTPNPIGLWAAMRNSKVHDFCGGDAMDMDELVEARRKRVL